MATATIFRVLTLCVILFAAAHAAREDDEFDAWKRSSFDHPLVRKDIPEAARKAVFLKNLKEIDDDNAVPDRTHESGPNFFTGLTDDERKEFLSENLLLDNPSSHKRSPTDGLWGGLFNRTLKADKDVPVSWDWRSRHVVTPIKNQAQCGS